MSALEQLVRAAASAAAARMPPGLGERGVGICLRAELEAYGASVEQEQPVVVVYHVSDGRSVVAQVGRIDFVVNGELGIELKTTQSITQAHRNQAIGYSLALGLPVLAVALGDKAHVEQV
jgi:GxxExxY protein